MIVQNISKMDHKVTIELSADELIRICNIFYMTKEKKMIYIINYIVSWQLQWKCANMDI